MGVITISHGWYSRGKEIAEKLAAKLNYKCISREIILETCAEFNIPEIKLTRALHDAPTVLERFQGGRERYFSYYHYELLKHVKMGNVVYYGLAGHYILRDIAHVLKVRITSDMKHRVSEEMNRANISSEDALFILKKDDEERRKWGIRVYGTDTWDSRLYDIVLHIDTLTVDDAVQILYETAQKPYFQITAESQRIINNIEKSAKIHSMLVKLSLSAGVVVKDGCVVISNAKKEYEERIKKLVLEVDGITSVTIKESVVSKPHYINPFYNI